MAINSTGNLFAKASKDGTNIRLFKVDEMTEVKKFFRGKHIAIISSMVFNQKSSWLVVNSDQPTVHVYSIPKTFHWANALAESQRIGPIESQFEEDEQQEIIVPKNPPTLWGGYEKSYSKMSIKMDLKDCTGKFGIVDGEDHLITFRYDGKLEKGEITAGEIIENRSVIELPIKTQENEE